MNMEIKQDKVTIKALEETLVKAFEGHSLTEHNLEKIQDVIEHELLTYSKEDVEAEKFLLLSLSNSSTEETVFQLFIKNKIYITVSMTITVDCSGFSKIGNSIKVSVKTIDIPETI